MLKDNLPLRSVKPYMNFSMKKPLAVNAFSCFFTDDVSGFIDNVELPGVCHTLRRKSFFVENLAPDLCAQEDLNPRPCGPEPHALSGLSYGRVFVQKET